MKKSTLITLLMMACMPAGAVRHLVYSPSRQLCVAVSDSAGEAYYSVLLNGSEVVLPSRLGVVTNEADLTTGLKLTAEPTVEPVQQHYTLTRTKRSSVDVNATRATFTFANDNKRGIKMQVTFVVENNDVAYRYTLTRGKGDNPKTLIVEREASSFRFPEGTTTFLSPQAAAMSGWERTKPSYEEEYTPDAPMQARSLNGVGYTFPCLFHVAGNRWALVSETGVDGGYCGSRLSDYDARQGYTVAYPMQAECNGWGSNTAAIALPGSTPWRTITVGESLKPIVETTIPFDVVEPQYTANYDYKPGRYTWSWLIWQDNSVNASDQRQFIDLAAKMGYEYVLVDGLWDKQIGTAGIEQLAQYAKTKGVSLLLWYNSNGAENDAPQGPRGVMNNSAARKQAMAWMQKIGVKGIKVDFFGGDKQHTMQLYEDILTDANMFGLQVIFHGCTLPRGWERMYPNYVASEAALASENVYFTEHHAQREGFEMSMHPFCRNTVGSFDWGGVIMNRYMSRDNHSRHRRYTSDVFELATAITNQTSVNCVEVTPNVVDSLSPDYIKFLRELPTTWDDVRFLAGYPGKYVVLARRQGDRWYVGAINGTDKPIQVRTALPEAAGNSFTLLTDVAKKSNSLWPEHKAVAQKLNKKGDIKLTLQPMGGALMY